MRVVFPLPGEDGSRVAGSAKDIEEVGNHGPNAVQGPTTKQPAVENLKHTHAHSHMITIETTHTAILGDRNSTSQK